MFGGVLYEINNALDNLLTFINRITILSIFGVCPLIELNFVIDFSEI